MLSVKCAARAFYMGGQRDPEPVLRLLSDLLRENTDLYLFPEGRRDPDACYWIAASSEPGEGLVPAAMQVLFKKAIEERDSLGLVLDPGEHPLYLSRDLMEEIVKRADPALAPQKEKGPSAKDLLEKGDCLRREEGGFSGERALSAYQAAYQMAVREKDSYIYPEICLRLGEFYPELYSREELLALFDEAIAHFRLRVCQGDKDAPDRLVYALRLKELAQAGGWGRMRPRRSLPESFFEF